MEEVLARVTRDDLVRGNWSVSGEELNTWVDVSMLATDVVLEKHSDILEDACWLCLKRHPAYKFSRALYHGERSQPRVTMTSKNSSSAQTPCASTIG